MKIINYVGEKEFIFNSSEYLGVQFKRGWKYWFIENFMGGFHKMMEDCVIKIHFEVKKHGK